MTSEASTVKNGVWPDALHSWCQVGGSADLWTHHTWSRSPLSVRQAVSLTGLISP